MAKSTSYHRMEVGTDIQSYHVSESTRGNDVTASRRFADSAREDPKANRIQRLGEVKHYCLDKSDDSAAVADSFAIHELHGLMPIPRSSMMSQIAN